MIAELMAEHAVIADLIHTANATLDNGDRNRAMATCAEIADLFGHHADKEGGLFAELRGEGTASPVIDRLEKEHRQLAVGLALVVAGDTYRQHGVLANLMDHAEREDSDLFPAALLLLPDAAWERICTTHGADDDLAAIH